MTFIFSGGGKGGGKGGSGGDDDKAGQQDEAAGGPTAGNYNLGDEIGTHIGEGHDVIEDPIS